MVLSAALEDRIFDEVKRLCYAGLDTTALRRGVEKSLRRAVPFESYCSTILDPLSGLPAGVLSKLHDQELSEEDVRFFLERIYFDDDHIGGFGQVARGRSPVVLLSEATGGGLDRSLRHREFYGPKGYGYELWGVFVAGRTSWGTLELGRERGSPDFTAREVALIKRLVPHLGAGLRAATLRVRASLGPDGDGVPGVLTLDRHGEVAQHTPAAEKWLRELGDIGPGWRDGNGLPVAVSSVASAARRALGHGNGRDEDLVPRLRTRGRSGLWLALQADLTEHRPGRPSEVVVVIEPAGPKDVAWLQTTAYGLSERERDVVELVVCGASTKQISNTLYISEYTVQEHLSNIFDKVSVRNRRELVKRLYFDNLYPSLA